MRDESKTNDKRRSPRRRTLKEGTIVFDAGQSTMQCKILDTSETGARLHVPNVTFLPDRFQLKIRYGAIRTCEVIWKKGPTVGVQFSADPAAEGDSAIAPADVDDRSMRDASKTHDKRRSPRRPTLKNGTIVFDEGQKTMQCKILDTSETGARLHVPNVMFMPEQFQLKIRYGGVHNCEVIWQKGPTVGVQFVD